MKTESANKMRIALTICVFHLHFADSATAQFNYTHVLLFVCGLHELLCIPQRRLRIPQLRLFLERNWAEQCFKYLFVESITAKKIKKSSNGVDSATNLILVCFGIRIQCTECTVWPRNVLQMKTQKKQLAQTSLQFFWKSMEKVLDCVVNHLLFFQKFSNLFTQSFVGFCVLLVLVGTNLFPQRKSK